MQFLKCLLASILLLGAVSAAPSRVKPKNLPIIDLGYVKQQATEYNATGGYYIFRNIRFAAPPLGNLRLRKPQPPLREKGIQNGNYAWDTACAQPDGDTSLMGSEDCLLLDIYVPKSVADSLHRMKEHVPVLAWWHGGGYVMGSKHESGSPWGLYEQAKQPFIFVAANYRLGALGFMAPPDAGVDSNIGLHDTQAAMDWIGRYIGRFGGDTKKVTAMGLSAGGGVIVHAIVSHGGKGKGKLPFQQAILQSPGWAPESNPAGRIPIWEAFKKNTKCADVTCIRALPSAPIQIANALTLGQWASGALGATSGFYPVVDGDYVPDFPVKLLAEDKFHKEVKSIVSSSTRWEGGYYVSVGVNDADFKILLTTQYTTNETIIGMLEAEYPSDGTSAGAYRRAVEVIGDLAFNCNGYWLARAFSAEKEPGHHSRRYMFNLESAIHGIDLSYTFDEGGAYSASSAKLADQHQKLIVDYTVRGEPALKNWPEWSEEQAKAMWLNETGLAVGDDFYAWAINVDRCEFLKDKILGKG